MILANIYLCKVSGRNTRKRYEICSKLAIKTPERQLFSSASVIDFAQVNVISDMKWVDWPSKICFTENIDLSGIL